MHHSADTQTLEIEQVDRTRHRFRYLNPVPLNESNQDVKVKVLKYDETRPGMKKHRPPSPGGFLGLRIYLEERTLHEDHAGEMEN